MSLSQHSVHDIQISLNASSDGVFISRAFSDRSKTDLVDNQAKYAQKSHLRSTELRLDYCNALRVEPRSSSERSWNHYCKALVRRSETH